MFRHETFQDFSWFPYFLGHRKFSFDLWISIIHNSIHGALQFAVMELHTICGDPSSAWWSSIILLWSSMIEMSTEFHNKLGSSVAANYQYIQYKLIWKFRSIIDMDFSISIYRVPNLTWTIMSKQPLAVAPTKESPSENKGILAGTRQLKQISEQKGTLSCHSSHLLCLFKWINQHERPMLSQSELLCLEICVDYPATRPALRHISPKKRFRYDGKFF